MSIDNKELFKLLKWSNELIKNKKSLFKEDREKSKRLSKLLVRIEGNLHLRQKTRYIELLENFLTNQINAEDFSFFFIAKYDSINQDLRVMKKNFEQKFDELSNLLIETKDDKYKIGIALMVMHEYCDGFDSDPDLSLISEEKLRNSAKTLLSQFQRT